LSTRQYWGIGEKPIGNLLAILETKGVRAQVSPHLRDPESASEAGVLAEEFCVSLDERT
jgi:hypothetical protein